MEEDVEWININFGEVLIFNQALPHGNVVNNENETRWSMNCRFKSIFTHFGDKKIGEFFEPITLRKISELGMKYNLPKLNEWLNPFIGSGFNDQEITIATLLNDSRDFLLHKKRLFYTAKRATVDLLILNEIKSQS